MPIGQDPPPTAPAYQEWLRPAATPRWPSRPHVGPATVSLHIDAVVNAVAHIDIKAPRLTKERFIAGGAAAVPVAGGVILGIRLRFHNHAPEQAAVLLAFHQQAANQLGCDHLGRATEEGVRERLGKGGGYGGWLL